MSFASILEMNIFHIYDKYLHFTNTWFQIKLHIRNNSELLNQQL
jgi:hypothetical protein